MKDKSTIMTYKEKLLHLNCLAVHSEQYLFSFIKFLGLEIIEAAYTRCSWFHTLI